jgi:hypothetical protein
MLSQEDPLSPVRQTRPPRTEVAATPGPHHQVQGHRLPGDHLARDIEDIRHLDEVLAEAEQLRKFSKLVAIVPKDPKLGRRLERLIPNEYLPGYSCPTRYGGTTIPPSKFTRPVHILGGRADVQRRIAAKLPVYSFDCNRFTLDAAYRNLCIISVTDMEQVVNGGGRGKANVHFLYTERK